MVTDSEAREWTSLRKIIDITLKVGYGEESPIRRADIVDEILKGVSDYRNFIRRERDAEWSVAAKNLVRAINKQYPTPPYKPAFLTTGGCAICAARDVLNAFIEEVK